MGLFDFFYMGKSGNKNSYTMEAQLEQQKIAKGMPDFNEEFSQELSYRKVDSDIQDPVNSYSDNGINLEPSQDTLKLTYKGILAKKGAQEISAVIGYGNNLKWEDEKTYLMKKAGDGKFELMFPVERNGNINIAFKDGLENWDNNSGMNYSFVDDINKDSH